MALALISTLRKKYIIAYVLLQLYFRGEIVIIINSKSSKLFSVSRLVPILGLLLMIAVMPDYFKESTENAVEACITLVIPSLFCYIVLTRLIVASKLVYPLGRPFARLFFAISHLPGKCAGVFILSFVSGFPTGALAAVELYRCGEITKKQASELVAFADNTGPALPVMLIGASLLGNVRLGFAIYIIEVVAVIITVFLLRPHTDTSACGYAASAKSDLLGALTDSVGGSVKSCALLCAYVVSFSVFCDALAIFLDRFAVFDILRAYIELVGGARMLAGAQPDNCFVPLCGAVCFGGLCVHMQAAAVCREHDIPMSKHFRVKLTEAIIGILIASVYVRLRYIL